MGVVAMREPKGLGPQNPNQNVARRVDRLGPLLTRNRVFKIFRPTDQITAQISTFKIEMFLIWIHLYL